jgi:hypothetical protein
MVAPKALVSSLSSLPMTLAMLFNNSMVMTGKVVHLKFVRIVSLALALDSVDEAASEVGVVSEEALVVVEASEVVEDMAGALAVAVEALVAAMEELLRVSMLELLLHLPTPSQTMLLPARREARRSTFAT